MSLVVKICGLNEAESLDAALAAGADMVGFVFFPASPRFVSAEAAGKLAAPARGRAAIAALVVDLDDAAIDAIVAALRPDWLQLHGKESVARTGAIRQRFGLKVMKAIGISTPADLAVTPAYAKVADRLLLDAKPPAGADRPGGHGRAFDWGMLADVDPALGYMLSGGLDPENVGRAIAATEAAGVDVSSGVETAPGIKSPDRIRAFIAAARRAERLRSRVAAAVGVRS